MSKLSRTSVATRLAAVAVMVATGALAACGQKGPLTLPATAKGTPPAAAAASAPASAAPAAPR